MPIATLTIDAGRLWTGDQPEALPLAFVDLDQTRDWPDEPVLPPCPVIGLGDAGHPLASLLDAVVEPPVTAAGIAELVLARPLSAAAAVQLLRILPGLPIESALVAESMAYAMLQGSDEHRSWLAQPAAITAGPAGEVACLREGERLIISLARPAAGNAIDRPMREALRNAFALPALDSSIAKVILRGEGKAFSLGAERAEFGTTRDPATAHAIRMQTLPAPLIARCADRLEAHIQGACVGSGLEMAAWSRRILALPGAWFQLPELGMGILPGAGGCVSLSRRIGRQRTALMLLSGKRISAKVALEWGLIDAVVDHFPAD